MLIRQIFDERLAQYAYLIGCQVTGQAILIDPKRYIDRYIQIAEKEKIKIVAVADTHIHADYVSGAREFAHLYGVKVYASDEGDEDWKYEWLRGSDYNYQLLRDKDIFKIGNVKFKVMHTPGHTPEHLSFLVFDLASGAAEPVGIVTGDFVFVGDVGRPDLLETAAGIKGVMEPSARTLYHSIQLFKELEDFIQVWPAHGAGSSCGKALGSIPQSTVGYELRYNPSILAADEEYRFVSYILEGQPEPPPYFARMKQVNKFGPPILGGLPEPELLDISAIRELAGRTDVAIVDTRNRKDFMAGHIPGSLFAPLDKMFPTVAGSYIEENMPIYLIIEEDRLKEAIIEMIGVGLDNIVGYAEPKILKEYETIGVLKKIETVEFNDLINHPSVFDEGLILDVRKGSEYAAGHIPDSVNIPHTRLLLQKDMLPAEKTLFVHCQGGGRAAVASAFLDRYGYKVIYVDGNFTDWIKSGGEIVKE